jgi:hypothetical protein
VILETWDPKAQEEIDKSRKQLENAYAFISRKADGFIHPALQKAWGLVDRESSSDATDSLQRAPSDAEITDQVSIHTLNYSWTRYAQWFQEKVLTVPSKAHAEEFLRLSQGELHVQLDALKTEYVAAVRRLGEEARSFRINTLRDALQRDTALQAELRDDIIGESLPLCSISSGADSHLRFVIVVELESQSIDIRELAYQEIKKAIRKSFTWLAAKMAFQTNEARIARLWLGLPKTENDEVAAGSDSKAQADARDIQPFTDEDSMVEAAAQRTLDNLGFMLRAPIIAAAVMGIALAYATPLFVLQSPTYHLSMDVIHQQYKDHIVQPWLESLNKEGERTLLGVIRLSSDAARDLLNNSLEREETRYQRELETKQRPPDQEAVENLVAAFVNLLAAEEALQELNGRVSSQ